jgi:hypothetical protein
MSGYVIVFDRDKAPNEWRIVGPFETAAHAGDYAKKVYRANGTKWVVIPLTDTVTGQYIFGI